VAFRWTVLLLAAITAMASRVFSRLRHDRPLPVGAVTE